MLLGEGFEEAQEPARDVLPSQVCSALDPEHLSAHPKVSVSLSNSPFGARLVPRPAELWDSNLCLKPPTTGPFASRTPTAAGRVAPGRPQRVLHPRYRLRFIFVYFQTF